MPTLSEQEIQQLAASIQKDLSDTVFACSTLNRILGGSASFTFRGDLVSPLTLSDGTEAATAVVKKATDFAAINVSFELESGRSNYENVMLETLANIHLGPSAVTVRTPQALLYLAASQTQVIEDLHPAVDCASLLTSRSTVSPRTDWSEIGFALGSWLRAFHHWSNEPVQYELRTALEKNCASQDLKWRTTYATMVDIASKSSSMKQEDVEVLKDVKRNAEQEHKDAMQAHVKSLSEDFGPIHGDFWTGNVLLDPVFLPRLYVIDFEFAHIGHRAMDLGQMLGDLLEKSCIFRLESPDFLAYDVAIKGVVQGYGVITEELAYRVIIHAGVHVINWCARNPNAGMRDKVEALMQSAVQIILKAWSRERAWFSHHVLGCLFVGAA